MSIELNEIVPIGRSLREYAAMFNLSAGDMTKRILGCGDGPASFNAELSAAGRDVVSIDPLYELRAEEIKNRFDECFNDVFNQVDMSSDNWVWTFHNNLSELKQYRIDVMEKFVDDFPTGLREGRYKAESVPYLSFKDDEFDLCLCSHFLFLYSEQMDLQFHMDSILELCRVATEVRIFPLLALNCEVSPFVELVQEVLDEEGYHSEIVQVHYELQKGGNEMLKIVRG